MGHLQLLWWREGRREGRREERREGTTSWIIGCWRCWGVGASRRTRRRTRRRKRGRERGRGGREGGRMGGMQQGLTYLLSPQTAIWMRRKRREGRREGRRAMPKLSIASPSSMALEGGRAGGRKGRRGIGMTMRRCCSWRGGNGKRCVWRGWRREVRRGGREGGREEENIFLKKGYRHLPLLSAVMTR